MLENKDCNIKNTRKNIIIYGDSADRQHKMIQHLPTQIKVIKTKWKKNAEEIKEYKS